MNKCMVCGHIHNTPCKKKKADGTVCGCLSHSSKFDKGAKFNPGSGKRGRMIDRMKK